MKLSDLPRPFFVLAPMDDVTDTVFRQVVADCAPPDLFFTEFVNVDGLQSPGRPKLLKRLQFTPKEQPLIAQIWGLKPDNFYKTAQELVAMGYAGIDLNMGCPDKTIIKHGACSALITNPDLAVEIIKATQAGAAGRIPISVKTRLGFASVDFSWHRRLLEQHLDMLSIHGRTRAQMSKVPADWDAIGTIRELRDQIAPSTLIVGNGDVMSRQQGRALASQYKLDGIMIGRAIFSNPYIFAEHSSWPSVKTEQRIALYAAHVRRFAATWQSNERPVPTLNKFCKVYISGFDGAKEFRERLMSALSTDELLTLLHDFKPGIHEEESLSQPVSA
jgi:tRNA-dihydrouridine synthase